MVGARDVRRLGQVGQAHHVFLQPLAVGMLAGDRVLQLLVADDPMARQGDVERDAGKYGAKRSRISKPSLDNMGPGTDRELPVGGEAPVWQERPKARSTQGLGGQKPKYRGRGSGGSRARD